MARESSIRKSANVALIRGHYANIVEQSLRALVGAEDTLVIDVLGIYNELNLYKFGLGGFNTNLKIISPVTAFQFTQFIKNDLSDVLAENSIKTIAILGIKPMFFDQNLLSNEYESLLRNSLRDLNVSAAEHDAQAVILTFNESFNSERNSTIDFAIDEEVDAVFNLNEVEVCVAK